MNRKELIDYLSYIVFLENNLQTVILSKELINKKMHECHIVKSRSVYSDFRSYIKNNRFQYGSLVGFDGNPPILRTDKKDVIGLRETLKLYLEQKEKINNSLLYKFKKKEKLKILENLDKLIKSENNMINLYLKHNQDIDDYNNQLMEDYNKKLELYDKAKKEHENHLKVENREKSLADKKLNIYESESKNLSKLKEMYSNQLNNEYNKNILFGKYRNYICVIMMLEYLESGRCESLEGANGAYNLYESELRQNIIISELKEVKLAIEKSSEDIKKNQYMLYQAIQLTNKQVKDLVDRTDRLANSSLNTNLRLTDIDIQQKLHNQELELFRKDLNKNSADILNNSNSELKMQEKVFRELYRLRNNI